MQTNWGRSKSLIGVIFVCAAFFVGGCSSSIPVADSVEQPKVTDVQYIIGPRDELDIFVWRSPELSKTVPVRPDGRISIPLVDDMMAADKTPSELARDIEKSLSKYVQDPIVSVIVTNFVGPYAQQVRVVGEATDPQAIAFNDDMTVLDVMIAVGGMTEFADGNGAVIVRKGQKLRVRLDDLLNDGDIDANVAMQPGDVLIIPETWF
ncbi:XrtA/PEP-CTERM system exopolysaccharide export protein [Aestuariispira ectoiniformans]|uniref:XrtA/PEP-CTERM system exopolysaccharide export protein n=1 Tax=Aestuariispira ectoiniformans TaxID=2775080 RepID=UPI00223BFFC6|nr:XrtA/PEP-CTERM system exopolysaccharide export protein [Aestuariispira ectoiniformans]